MPEMPDETRFDKRLIDRHLQKGIITPKQLKTRIDRTEDAADLAEHLDLEAMEDEKSGLNLKRTLDYRTSNKADE